MSSLLLALLPINQSTLLVLQPHELRVFPLRFKLSPPLLCYFHLLLQLLDRFQLFSLLKSQLQPVTLNHFKTFYFLVSPHLQSLTTQHLLSLLKPHL
jgi:hypothetical protein